MKAIRILVVSDTHGSVDAWTKIKNNVQQVDQLVHLGDFLYHGPRNPIPTGYDPMDLAGLLKTENLIAVRGNCDADIDLMLLENEDLPKFMVLTFGKLKVVCLHGENIRNDKDLVELLQNYNADVVAFGHTHTPRLEKTEQGVILNPGSPSLPKKNNPPTFGLITVEDFVEISILTLSGEVWKKVRL